MSWRTQFEAEEVKPPPFDLKTMKKLLWDLKYHPPIHNAYGWRTHKFCGRGWKPVCCGAFDLIDLLDPGDHLARPCTYLWVEPWRTQAIELLEIWTAEEE